MPAGFPTPSSSTARCGSCLLRSPSGEEYESRCVPRSSPAHIEWQAHRVPGFDPLHGRSLPLQPRPDFHDRPFTGAGTHVPRRRVANDSDAANCCRTADERRASALADSGSFGRCRHQHPSVSKARRCCQTTGIVRGGWRSLPRCEIVGRIRAVKRLRVILIAVFDAQYSIDTGGPLAVTYSLRGVPRRPDEVLSARKGCSRFSASWRSNGSSRPGGVAQAVVRSPCEGSCFWRSQDSGDRHDGCRRFGQRTVNISVAVCRIESRPGAAMTFAQPAIALQPFAD